MPAAAVIPAPVAYINVVAVKKLVVEFLAFAQHCSFNVRNVRVVSSIYQAKGRKFLGVTV